MERRRGETVAWHWSDQAPYRVRFEWGPEGIARVAARSDVVIVVDVLRFTTAVDVAVSRGAVVYPTRTGPLVASIEQGDDAGTESPPVPASALSSLSPASLLDVPRGTRVALASPNGAALSLLAMDLGASTIFAGCLRNATAVAAAALDSGGPIAVIAAGERWGNDGALRPCFEDLVEAGAVVAALQPASTSPEALVAQWAFQAADRAGLPQLIAACSSGRELVERGMARDVDLAAQLNASDAAPILSMEGFYGPRRRV